MRDSRLWPLRKASSLPPRQNSPTIKRSLTIPGSPRHLPGVVTERYANLGTLMQAGTSSSTQAMPLVVSEDDLFRLVIPVPESYVRYIRIGDPVNVRVPSLNRTFREKSYDSRWMCGKTRAPCTPKSMCRTRTAC